MNLMYGVQNGWIGAQAAYDYLFPFIGVAAQPCLGLNLSDLACRAGWALDFPSTAALTPGPAQLISPTPGSTLTDSTQVFQWNSGIGVSSYQLLIGTAQGGNDIYSGPVGENLSALVDTLPNSGGTFWVRLSSNIGGAWQSTDYSFTAANTVPAVVGFNVRNTVSVDGRGVQTAPPLSTAAGDVLVAFVSSSGPDPGPETMTVSGGGLTWTLVARANGQKGVSEIWTATTATARSGIAVTSTPTLGTPDQSLVVVTFAGSAGIGASATANGAIGGPLVSLTPTRAGSLVFGVGNDWNGAVSRTVGPGQTMVHEFLNLPNGDTFWIQRVTNPVVSAGVPVRVNDIAPINHIWNLAAVEILPAPRSTPTITWPAPAPIVYGTLLSTTQLNATASVPGTFVYTPAAGGTALAAGAQTLSVTFTPVDQVTYATATASVSLTVNKATPTISWNAPTPIVYGTALTNAAHLNATGSVPGPIVNSDSAAGAVSAGAVLGAGVRTLTATLNPTNTSYSSVSTTVSLTVSKATPVITWAPTPSSITFGTAVTLGAQLNAAANSAGSATAGTFAYTPPSGSVLGVGTQQLAVTFKPTDAANFTTPVTATVPITVTAAASGGTPSPVKIGTTIAGTFNDATGHSGQSHLVFAKNANVWWLFTLSSAHDSAADHTVRSYVSSGPDLATATWTAAQASPHLADVGGGSLLAGGRSLGVALITIGTTDYVHVFASAAVDGQQSSNGHIRAQLGATTIAWQGTGITLARRTPRPNGRVRQGLAPADWLRIPHGGTRSASRPAASSIISAT